MRIHVLTQFPPELPFLLLLLCLPKLLFPGTLLFFEQSQKIRPSQLAVYSRRRRRRLPSMRIHVLTQLPPEHVRRTERT